MQTPAQFRRWVLRQIDRLTLWSQPMTDADVPERTNAVEMNEDWPGPELNVLEDTADLVREAGEISV